MHAAHRIAPCFPEKVAGLLLCPVRVSPEHARKAAEKYECEGARGKRNVKAVDNDLPSENDAEKMGKRNEREDGNGKYCEWLHVTEFLPQYKNDTETFFSFPKCEAPLEGTGLRQSMTFISMTVAYVATDHHTLSRMVAGAMPPPVHNDTRAYRAFRLISS